MMERQGLYNMEVQGGCVLMAVVPFPVKMETFGKVVMDAIMAVGVEEDILVVEGVAQLQVIQEFKEIIDLRTFYWLSIPT